jgi:flagellar biosynthesis protein FliQ
VSLPQVMELGRDLLYTALLLALPTLAVSLVVGLLISIFQTVTSIQEQTLTFVPRLVAVAVVLVLTMPWALQIAIHFTVRMLWQAAEVRQ